MEFVRTRGGVGQDVCWIVKTHSFAGLDVGGSVKTRGFVDPSVRGLRKVSNPSVLTPRPNFDIDNGLLHRMSSCKAFKTDEPSAIRWNTTGLSPIDILQEEASSKFHELRKRYKFRCCDHDVQKPYKNLRL